MNRRRFQPARRFQPTNLADVYPIFIDFASVVQTVSLETTAEKRPVRTRALPRMSRRESTNIGSIYVGAFAPVSYTHLDVYKRQTKPFASASTAGEPASTAE